MALYLCGLCNKNSEHKPNNQQQSTNNHYLLMRYWNMKYSSMNPYFIEIYHDYTPYSMNNQWVIGFMH